MVREGATTTSTVASSTPDDTVTTTTPGTTRGIIPAWPAGPSRRRA